MLKLIKNHRGAKTKEFIGVIGIYFIEILDDDPFIMKFLSAVKSKYRHTPSDRSRFLTPDERMVLKSHENNYLVIIKTEPTEDLYTCEIRLFKCQPTKHPPKELVVDVLRLAGHRWRSIKVRDKIYSLNRPLPMQLVEEILAAESL